MGLRHTEPEAIRRKQETVMRSRNEPPSPCELAVLRAVIDCGTIDPAAEALNLSPYTVNTHLDRMRERYCVRTTLQLAVMAVRKGWVSSYE